MEQQPSTVHQHTKQGVRFLDDYSIEADVPTTATGSGAVFPQPDVRHATSSRLSMAWSMSDHPLISILAAAAVSVGLYLADPWISVPCPILSQLLAHS